MQRGHYGARNNFLIGQEEKRIKKLSFNKKYLKVMQDILIGTKNPHKAIKLSEIVHDYFIPRASTDIPEVKETGNSFKGVAEEKAIKYSETFNGLAIATDGGAIIPALSEWEPLRTKRFGNSNQDRITQLLKMMDGKSDRTIEWHEALAVADKGEMLFSSEAQAIDAVVDIKFNPQFYKEGIWLCSIMSFPSFGGRNFFELTEKEQLATEDSWTKLADTFKEFMKTYHV